MWAEWLGRKVWVKQGERVRQGERVVRAVEKLGARGVGEWVRECGGGGGGALGMEEGEEGLGVEEGAVRPVGFGGQSC